ncbi:MAG: DUF1697 domain-containing protein [Actinomycetales bacterium]|nr:DUF1697 domain-containing protein [Actinomycetales bacterium]
MQMLAFPRGINVGGRVVPMARLRALLEGAGFTGVRTVLASGNVAFTPPEGLSDGAPRARALVEQLMSDEFGYTAVVQVVLADAVERCLADAPWGEAPPDEHHYLVLVDDDAVRAELLVAGGGLDAAVEEVAPAELGVYWRTPKGQTTSSTFGVLIGTARVKKHVTTRKLDTLRKLLA